MPYALLPSSGEAGRVDLRKLNMKRKFSPSVTWLTALSLTLTMAMSTFVGGSAAKSITKASSLQRRVQKPIYPELSRYATNLTDLARSQRLNKTAGQDSAAVEQAITILATQKRNPIILEDAALNTRIVAEGIAQRIAKGDVPAALKDKELYSLNLDALFHGLKTPAEVEARVNLVFAETAAANGAVILFVDQLYQFAGTRALRAASDKVRDRLDRGDFRIVGATTNEAFEQYIAADASLQRVFKTIKSDGDDETVADINSDGFLGDAISVDLREMIASGKPSDRVSVILQVRQ